VTTGGTEAATTGGATTGTSVATTGGATTGVASNATTGRVAGTVNLPSTATNGSQQDAPWGLVLILGGLLAVGLGFRRNLASIFAKI
jgi:hypothetical protein